MYLKGMHNNIIFYTFNRVFSHSSRYKHIWNRITRASIFRLPFLLWFRELPAELQPHSYFLFPLLWCWSSMLL